MSRTPLYYFDTNILIYFFQGNSFFENLVKPYFKKLADDKIELVISAVAVTEFLSLGSSEKKADDLLEALLEIPNLEIVEIDTKIAVLAAELRRKYAFSTPDCFHLATAITKKAEKFISNDKKLKRCKEIVVEVIQ